MRLYDLSEQYRSIQELLDQDEPYDIQELHGRLALIEGRIEDRIEYLAGIVRERELCALAAKSEAERLAKRADGWARDADKLTAWIQKFLEDTGITDPIKGTRFTVAIKTNPPAVRVINEAEIPPWFFRTIPAVPESQAIDKKAILNLYRESGELVPGTDIERRKTLTIK